MARKSAIKERLPEYVQALETMDRIRKRRGWSVEQLAEKAGFSAAAYYSWLAGGYAPKLESFMMAVKALGCEVVLRVGREKADGDSHGLTAPE